MEDTSGHWACSMCGAQSYQYSPSGWAARVYCAECWFSTHSSGLPCPRDANVGPSLLQLARTLNPPETLGGGAGPPLADGCGDIACHVCRGPSASAGEAGKAGGQGPQLRPAGRDGSGEAEEPPAGEDWFRSWEMG